MARHLIAIVDVTEGMSSDMVDGDGRGYYRQTVYEQIGVSSALLAEFAKVLHQERASIMKALQFCQNTPAGIGRGCYVGIAPTDIDTEYSIEVWHEKYASPGCVKTAALAAVSFLHDGARETSMTFLFPLWELLVNANSTVQVLGEKHFIGAFIKWRDYTLCDGGDGGAESETKKTQAA